jgi:hypothetical protein
MPIDDFEKYCDSQFQDKNDMFFVNLSENLIQKKNIYYYLVSLFNQKIFSDYEFMYKKSNLNVLSISDREYLQRLLIIVYRNLGKINLAYKLLAYIDFTTVKKDFYFLKISLEIYEIFEDFSDVKNIIKLMMTYHESKIDDSILSRYYQVIRM